MARDIVVERLHASPVAEQKVEIVERKGLGHPDSICDGIMEDVAQALVREYLARFGTVLHFNLDKGMLVAGRPSLTLTRREPYIGRLFAT